MADSHSPRDGRFIEKVGTYNPLLKKDDPNRISLKLEAIQGWLSKGAQPTDRVARFLAAAGVMTWVHGQNLKKGVPGKKAKERAEERAQKAADAAAAAAEAAAAPAPEPTPEPEVAAEAVVEAVPEVAAEAPAAEPAAEPEA